MSGRGTLGATFQARLREVMADRGATAATVSAATERAGDRVSSAYLRGLLRSAQPNPSMRVIVAVASALDVHPGRLVEHTQIHE